MEGEGDFGGERRRGKKEGRPNGRNSIVTIVAF